MQQHPLTALDWSWIVGLLVVSLLLAIYDIRKTSQSIQNYFAAGKTTPWWLLGTSIVATTFAADTPLVVSGLVIREGIAGNWFWWSVVPSGMLGVFFFAHLWRRSGCLTQAEFATLRYGQQQAQSLRLFYVFYHGVIRNAATLGFVNLAMANIITTCTSYNQWQAVLFCFIFTVIYTVLGGINGVLLTDFIQFLLAIIVAILIAYYAVDHVGGLEVLGRFIADRKSLSAQPLADYVPTAGTTAWNRFLIFITIYWMASTPTDCNGYAVQRLIAAQNERHAVWGYLWFNFAHYVIRSWPWILVGLVATMLYNNVSVRESEKVYIRVIFDACPSWLIGPALASLLAAYMSTVNTHLNWGASYLVNDFYMPYVNPNQSPKHYVYASHAATVLLAMLGVGMTFTLNSIVSGWGLIGDLMSGMGIVGVLRWLWWRVTAWTEIGCMIAAGLSSLYLHFWVPQLEFPFTLLAVVPTALVGAAIGTFFSTPETRETLTRFVNKVRPPMLGWNPVKLKTDSGTNAPSSGLLRSAVCWILSTVAIYAAMFGVGDLCIKSKIRGLILCGLAVGLSVVAGLIFRFDSNADDPDAGHADSGTLH